MRIGTFSLIVTFTLAARGPAQSKDDPGQRFFEEKIRPVLVEHCYSCHSSDAKKLKGGLKLDTKPAMLKGGETGPALVPGKPDESLLIKAMRYKHADLQMPPKGKLPDTVIANFVKWVEIGAPDPRYQPDTKIAKGINFEEAKKHWAFQPIRKPALPPVKNKDWPLADIDHFILAKLEAQGLTPSPAADRRTLIRRASIDLIGLPPTFAEVQAFVRDDSPDAFAKVVDRLLASPHYGERWARHWLDVARYADTKDGVLMFGDSRVWPYAFTYRDYVIRAFNEDVPFDRFIHEQLAADQIEPKVEPWRLSAMGFLTLGRLFDNNIHDVLDDRIDVVSRGLLGLTVSCARCHDHKYDAIATADYYALYGVFASCEPPLELPLAESAGKLSPAALEFEKKAGPKRQALRKFLDDQHNLLSEAARQRIPDYLVKAATTAPDPLETAIFFMSLDPGDLRPPMTHRWRRLLEQRCRADDPVFGPWHALQQLPPETFKQLVGAVVKTWQDKTAGLSPGTCNPLVQQSLTQTPLNGMADVARSYGNLLVRVFNESRKTPLAKGLEGDARQQLLDLVSHRDSPAYIAKSRTWEFMSRQPKDSFGAMRVEIDQMVVKAPQAPSRAMVLADSAELCEPRIFVRGNPGQLGESVPRQFLTILAGPKQTPFAHGSGRLDLAQAITAPGNPLTSRVIVNRVWMHHFGEPLVSTPSDFGNRSSPPSHPELLDYLAATFTASQEPWSLKRLHRMLMLSRTYQQVSFDRPDSRQKDPDNKYLWRMPRRRLDLESMRDSLLAISGRLDRTLAGRPVDIVGNPANGRRTIYGLVDRQSLPGLYRAFDFASPDQSAERRPSTTVPQQALFGINAPFMIEQAKSLAARPELVAEKSDEGKIAALYRLVMARQPDAMEIAAGLRFLAAVEESQKAGPSQLNGWQQYAQVLLLTNEAMFVD